jgi:hypothetical protein
MLLTLAAISSMILFLISLDSTPTITVTANAIVGGIVLFIFIEIFGLVSGAHFKTNSEHSNGITQENGTSKADKYILT